MANLANGEFSKCIWRIKQLAKISIGEFCKLANYATAEFSKWWIKYMANLANGEFSKLQS